MVCAKLIIRKEGHQMELSKESLEASRAVVQEIAALPPQRSWNDGTKIIALAIDRAVANERERCARIADEQADADELGRVTSSAPEERACWLWSRQTAAAIARGIRDLVDHG
jgi:hypothetical protein